MGPNDVVYKICDAHEWREAERLGLYHGSADDVRDGFIHLSKPHQVTITAAKYFAERPDLVLVVVDAAALGEALRYEPSRGGDLFPHLYGPLPIAAALAAVPLPWRNGRHVFPPGIPRTP